MPTSEYRINVVVAELGEREAADDHMEQFADRFHEIYPSAGAVMAANYQLHALDATFSVSVEGSAREAVALGGDMFCEVAGATGIPPTAILEIQAGAVACHESPATDEMLLAR